jgi:glycosyltransferase involved in cell wall biosynthesis
MQNNLVSIIIPVYNASRWIRKCVESCINQTYTNLEIIAVDDTSTDNSLEILKSINNHKLKYFSNPKKGAQTARNLGYSKSNGDYILFLDADDLLAAEKIEKQVAYLESNKKVDITYSDWEIHTYKENALESIGPVIHRQYIDFLKEILLNNWSPPFNYLMRKSVTEYMHEHGGWNENISVLQDRAYFTHLALDGFTFGYCKAGLSVYNRWSATSVSQTKSQNERFVQTETLLYSFLDKVIDPEFFNKKETPLYASIIKTELLKVQIQLKKKPDSDIGFKDLQWPNLGGPKSRMKILWSILKSKLGG